MHKKSYKKANELKRLSIPQEQLEALYGMIFGDGHLRPNTDGFHRLSLCHGDSQKDYLEWKLKILTSIFMKTTPVQNKDSTWTQCSISHPGLTNIYGLFYPQKQRRILRKTLNLMTPTSFLFWYLDDGSMIKASGNTILLFTNRYPQGDVHSLKSWLWQKYRIETFIMEIKGTFGQGPYYCLRFRKDGTIKFFQFISQSSFVKNVPTCMKYKFGNYL